MVFRLKHLLDTNLKEIRVILKVLGCMKEDNFVPVRVEAPYPYIFILFSTGCN